MRLTVGGGAFSLVAAGMTVRADDRGADGFGWLREDQRIWCATTEVRQAQVP